MKLREWARRRAGAQASADLEAGHEFLEQETRRVQLPPAWRAGVESFYDYLHVPAGVRTCSGTACQFARARPVEGPHAHCLGHCYAAPARSDDAPSAIPRTSLVPSPVVLRHLIAGARPDPELEYRDVREGVAVLDALAAAGLRGRGGAAFPTAAKWRVARATPAADRYVVANGDEGDPGAFVDRLLLEEDPHAVLAGMLACAQAIGARHGVVFIRREYPEARKAMLQAVEHATQAGWLGPLCVRVVSGAGSYVAGEETALLRAIEGLRAEPSPKPPYPAERGLDGLPTVIQNVETLAVVPWVVRERRRADTKVICVSGAVRSPGAVEVALGTPLREVLERGAGGPRAGQTWKMALVGGPMGRVVPFAAFDTALSFEALPGLGHGGVVVLDERVSAAALARHLFAFAASESCGNCAPCRIGCSQLASRTSATDLNRLLDTLELGSLCGFGQAVPRPLRDLLEHYPKELFPC
jgi:formate dehydrogenase iron-sulfur subunit